MGPIKRIALLLSLASATAWGQLVPTPGLIGRVLPGRSGQFVCERIPADGGREVYEYEAGPGDKVMLRGSDDLALAVAFNQYLRREAKLDYSWLAAGPLTPDGPLPRPAAKVRGECLAAERFFLNYCTYGYTLPWWGWDPWQRFLDWMAMNGINRPLLQAGQEAVWLRVWEGYGMTEGQVRSYFTGPAHLPWHRMANIDHWGGPLPMSYIEGQRRLEARIVDRARELGMTPILSGFAGHVPEELARLRPHARITRLKPGWGGLPPDYATWYLSPDDPLFGEIQARFLREQAALYGTDHLYAADPFNEMTPPSWDPAYLARVGAAIYEGMAAADPRARWYQMTWTFTNDRNWTADRLSAMLRSVPIGRMVLLDYVGETRELYTESENCHGLPFIWNYLGNFGGNTHFAAPAHKVASRIGAALRVPNCIGVGSTLEGLGATPFIYEMVFEEPWRPGGTVDVDDWIRGYADDRAGRADPAVEDAWSLLAAKVFVDGAKPTGTHGAIFQWIPDPGIQGGRVPEPAPAYRPEDLVAALGRMLKAEPASRSSDGYRYDVVNLTRQALCDRGLALYGRMQAAAKSGDLPGFQRESNRFLQVGRDLDDLLGTRREFLSGPWLADARSWGASPEEADYYEENARQIITSWQAPGGRLTDYASRQWNGLVRDYYLPRWEKWIDLTSESIRSGAPFPSNAYAAWIDDACARWVNAHGEGYATGPTGDPVETSRRLFDKYFP